MQKLPDVSLALTEHLPRCRRGREVNDEWIGPVRHPVWTLDYVGCEDVHTRVEHRTGSKTMDRSFPRSPIHWHVYAPEVTYFERYCSAMVHEEMWLQFRLNRPWPVFAGHSFIAIADPDQRLCELTRRMDVLYKRRAPGDALILHAMLLTVLAEVSAAAGVGREGSPDDPWIIQPWDHSASGDGEQLLSRVDRLIARRLANPPALDELAEALALSVSSLAHQFKAQTGMTVIERIRWLRIRQARVLLSRPDASAKTVANQLGFSSPSYFAKVFREVAGVTPEAYMRLMRRG